MRRPWRSETPAERPAPSPSSHTRSKTESRSIRGRISGPIPIPNPLDEEVAMRNRTPSANGTLDAFNFAAEPDSTKPEHRASPPHRRQLSTTPPGAPQCRVQVVPEVRTDRDSPEVPRGSPDTLRKEHKRTQSLGLRVSAFSLGSNVATKDSPPRKKSSLRGALSKLFGRKRNTGSQASTSARPTPEGSDPRESVLPRAIPGNREAELQRQAQSDYGRALRSHSVGPLDRLAIEGARNSLLVGANFSRRHPGTQSFRAHKTEAGEPSGLTPRPASISGELAGLTLGDETPENIGRAITKDHAGFNNKRRSRSLSALNDTGGNLEHRRLSGEIRYWRDSYVFEIKSVASSFRTEADDQPDDVAEHGLVEESPPRLAVEPFPVPDVSSMSEFSGMKITQSASMEQRMHDLEDKTKSLDKVVRDLVSVVFDHETPSGSIQAWHPEKSGRISYTPSDSRSRLTLAMSGGDGRQAVKQRRHHEFRERKWPGRHDRSTSSSGSDDYYGLDAASVLPSHRRHVSTTAIRGTMSLPALSMESSRPLTMEHYTTLMALLDTERSARLALEAKVKTLSRQLSVMSKSEHGLDSTRPPVVGSAFDYDDNDEGLSSPGGPRWAKHILYSGGPGVSSGTGAGEGAVAITGATGEDDGYETSAHDMLYGDDADDTDDAADRRKKADRTLSLSQMTMKKPQP